MAKIVVKCYTSLSGSRSMRNKVLILLMIAILLATNLVAELGCRAGPSHPQLYFASEDIPGLKTLKTSPSHSAIYNNIKTWADPRVNDEPPGEMLDKPWYQRDYMTQYIRFYVENMAFMYYMTDNTTYLNASKTWLLDLLNWSKWGHPGSEPVETSMNRMILLTIAHTTAFGYDTLYDYLTTEERTNLRNMMIERIGELYQAYIGESNARWPWSFDYPCTICITAGGIGIAGLALKGDWAGADDWIEFATFNTKRGLDTIGRDGATWEGYSYQIYGLEGVVPFLHALKRVTGQDLFADSHLDQVPYRYVYTDYNGYGLQFEDTFWGTDYLGWQEVDGYKVDRQLSFFYLLASEYDDGYAQWFANNYAAQYRMSSYLWKDPDITPKPPNDLPLTKYFRDTGYVIWRTGWGANDLLFAFKSGSAWGHAHPSQNEFGIYYQGKPLTCGVGYWLYTPTWPHNVMLVNGEGQADDSRDVGKILTVEEKSPYYRYLLGDATIPYQGKLDKWLRHVVFMEPNYFVMYDEVAASSPKQFDWLLQAPHLAGGQGGVPSLSLSGDLITLTGSGGGQLKVKIIEPQSFNSEIIPYYSDQSLQCYYAKVRPSTNQAAAQFLNVFFPDSVLSTNRIAVGNVVGVKVVDGDKLDLILFSRDGNPANEYIDLGGGYFQVIADGGGSYSFEGTGIRVQFNQYLVLRLQEAASPVNNPPVLNPIGDKTAVEEEPLEFTISAFDPDNDSLTYSANLTSLPPEASFNPATRTFSWTPTSGQAGTYNVHFEVTNGELSDSEDISIKVSADPLSISFVPPTDTDGASIDRDWTEVNTAVDSIYDSSSFIDWDKSLVGYWDFNESSGTIAHDKSGYGNDGTLKNGPQRVSGKFGNALEFDGADDYVEIPDNDTLHITDAITIEAWAKPSKVGNPDHYNYLVSKWPGYMLFTREDLVTFFYLNGVDNWYHLDANVPNYFDRNWHHLVATYDENGGIYKMKIYIDGVLYCGVAGLNGSIDTSGNPLTIGCRYEPSGSVYNQYSTGLIDEVRIWNHALSEEEIKASYNAGLHDLSRKFTDLADGNYQYYAYTTDLQGNSAQTETRSITISAEGPDTTPPVISNVASSDITSVSATIAWTTDESATSQVEYGKTEGLGSFTDLSTSLVTNHSVNLTGLDSETTYYYRVKSEDASGNPATSTIHNFATDSVNQPPVLNAIGNKSISEGQLLEFTISASDPDNDPITYSANLSSLPAGASFDAGNRTFSWTPGYNQASTYSNVHFEVSDGALTDSEDITITVSNVNRPPVLNSIGNKSINEGVLLQFTISASDPDNDPLTYSANLSSLPPQASFNQTTHIFSWTPTSGQAGTYSNVRFQVSDGALTDYEDITITVNSISQSDLNSDGAVNVLDMILIGQHWGEEGLVGWISEDVNRDGIIDVLDMVVVGQSWTA